MGPPPGLAAWRAGGPRVSVRMRVGVCGCGRRARRGGCRGNKNEKREKVFFFRGEGGPLFFLASLAPGALPSSPPPSGARSRSPSLLSPGATHTRTHTNAAPEASPGGPGGGAGACGERGAEGRRGGQRHAKGRARILSLSLSFY